MAFPALLAQPALPFYHNEGILRVTNTRQRAAEFWCPIVEEANALSVLFFY